MNYILLSLILLFNFGQVQNNTGTIEVIISETESDEGVVQMLIFNKDKGWPESVNDAWKIYTLPIENGMAKKTITDVPSGNYAITVFHDHDEDEKIRKNKVGYPIDGFDIRLKINK